MKILHKKQNFQQILKWQKLLFLIENQHLLNPVKTIEKYIIRKCNCDTENEYYYFDLNSEPFNDKCYKINELPKNVYY